jgi:hypothetical protein
MAIGTPTGIGSATGTGTSDTVTLTCSASASVGDLVAVEVSSSTTNRTLSSVTDSAGNTYSIDRTGNDAAQSGNVYIASSVLTSALTSGVSTITATFANSVSSIRQIVAAKVSGNWSGGGVDVANSEVDTGGTDFSIGLTTVAADTAVFVGARIAAAQTITFDSPVTELYDITSTSTQTVFGYVVKSAAGAATYTGTFTGAAAKHEIAVAYKEGSASAPSNTVAPVASGTPTTGQNLSCTTGTWTGSPTPTYTYQWQRAGVNIGGATASTYTLVEADEGNAIRCVVTATNASGSASANSNAITPEDEPANSVAPAVTGSPQIGQVLTCSTGTWTNNPDSYTYQWQADTGSGFANISGETVGTYTVDSGDVSPGDDIRCQVVASNENGSSSTVNSNTVTVVAGENDPACFIKWGAVRVATVAHVKMNGSLFPPL